MASVNLGRVGLVLRGAWSSSASYNPLDVVSYMGNSYAAIYANSNVLPTNASYWQSIAKEIQVSANGTTLSFD